MNKDIANITKTLEGVLAKEIVDWYGIMWAKEIYMTDTIPPTDSLKRMSLELSNWPRLSPSEVQNNE